jgi:hypothetical protein
MKQITRYLIPRYLWFLLWYKQWFRNHEGIKGFADQTMNWIMRSTLGLAKWLKRQNKQLTEKMNELTAELRKRLHSPVIEADEYPAIKGKIKRYTIAKFIFTVGDGFFNFFAAKAIIAYDGWISLIGQVLLALAMTYGFILMFEELFEEVLHLKPYKREHTEGRKWGKLATLAILAIAYEYAVYYLCKIRGVEIEGGNGSGMISTLMMLIGMLSPILAGYYDYMKSLYISPYKNTRRVEKLERQIAAKKNRIEANKQRMETQFKKQCQENWALLSEFRTYKENWNRKHRIEPESLVGHYSSTHDGYVKEAIERYKKETIHAETVQPNIIYAPTDNNKHNFDIHELFAHY